MSTAAPAKRFGKWQEIEVEGGSTVLFHEEQRLTFTLEEVADGAGLLAAIAVVADKPGATAEDIGNLVLAVDAALSLAGVIGADAGEIVSCRNQRAEKEAREGGN